MRGGMTDAEAPLQCQNSTRQRLVIAGLGVEVAAASSGGELVKLLTDGPAADLIITNNGFMGDGLTAGFPVGDFTPVAAPLAPAERASCMAGIGDR